MSGENQNPKHHTSDIDSQSNVDQDRPSFAVCLDKTGDSECKYHQELAAIESKLAEVMRKIKHNPVEHLLEEYASLKHQRDSATAIIGVSEYRDFTVGATSINNELTNKMKLLLTKQIDKMPIEEIDWKSYVKAATNFTNAQSYGSKVESVYRRKNNFDKVSPALEKGDALDTERNAYIEIKFTVVANPSYQYDIVQIRPHHSVSEYHVVTYDKDKDLTELYVLSKSDMAQELKLTGYQLAHGTESSKSSLKNPEYAIRFRQGSDIHKRWKRYKRPVNWQ
jgi:hypothetical protein